MKVLNWIGISFASVIGLVLIVAAGLLLYGQFRWKQTFDRPLPTITADTSPEGIARGEYLVTSGAACVDCHGGRNPDEGWLAGKVEHVDSGPIQIVFAVPNLTPDETTGLGEWSDAEIARAIREGVDKDGVGLIIMPAFNYHIMSDADVAAIIGYLRSIEPINNTIPSLSASAVAKTMSALGMFGPSPVGEPILASQPLPDVNSIGYGEYVTTLAGCRDCHGFDYTGGTIPASGPDTPPAPNLTRSGQLIGWSEADFITTLRTGVTPSGHTLDEIMPWPVYGKMSDSDLAAIFAYLQSLPGAPVENQ